MADPNDRVELNARQASGGSTANTTRYILATSLVLIIIVFAVMVFR